MSRLHGETQSHTRTYVNLLGFIRYFFVSMLNNNNNRKSRKSIKYNKNTFSFFKFNKKIYIYNLYKYFCLERDDTTTSFFF